MICPLNRATVPDPCPRLVGGRCDECREDLAERAALIQYGGMGLGRKESDELALQNAHANMRKQWDLFED